jgi:HrpA-like RNA helicase
MNGNLTEEGYKFAGLHISPQFTRAIITANSKDRCVGKELVTIAALMSVSQ